MAGMQNLMAQAAKMQKRLGQLEDELKDRMVEGSAGDGAVTAIASGTQEIMAVKIDESAVDPDDIETLEDLVIAAVNNALERSRELRQKEMEQITGGLNLPGVF